MKGAIGLQFNWIFVLITGILLFGVFFVQTQNAGKQARFEASLTLRESLQSMLATPTDNSYRKIEIPSTTIRNDCDTSASQLFLGESYLPVKTSFYGLHAPKKMTAGTFHLQVTDDVNILTSDRNVYVFVDSGGQEIKKIYDAFQGRKVLTDYDGQDAFPPEGTKLDYTIIYYIPNFGSVEIPPIIGNTRPSTREYNFIVVSPGSIENKIFHFTNFDLQRTPFSPTASQYYSTGDILGAIVDSDTELNKCITTQELRRTKAKLEITGRRTVKLAALETLGSPCNTLLRTANLEIIDALRLFDEDVDRNLLNARLMQINEYNSDLLRNNCAVIS